MALDYLSPDGVIHGSGYKSSKIEFNVNSHSDKGIKNFFRTVPTDEAPLGSCFTEIPN